MTFEEIRDYYERHGRPSGYDLNKKEHKEFKKAVKESVAFIDSMKGEKKFGIYLKASLASLTAPPKCANCDDFVESVRKDEFSEYCSRKCMGVGAKPKREATNIQRYGTKSPQKLQEIKEKTKITSMSRYGREHYTQTDEYKKIMKEKYIQRNGYELGSDEHSAALERAYQKRLAASHKDLNVPEMVKALRKTNMEKYGVTNASKLSWVKEKTKQTNLDRYGVTTALCLPENRRRRMQWAENNRRHGVEDEKSRDIMNSEAAIRYVYEQCHENLAVVKNEYGCSVTTFYRALREYGIEVKQHHRISGAEYEIRKFLEEHGIVTEYNTRKILGGIELDILLPEHRVAIEYNGIFWHSSLYKDKDYHKKKTEACKNVGIQLIHVWEDQWADKRKREIVKSKILHILGLSNDRVFARKTEIKTPTRNEADVFMEQNHIQGIIRGSKWVGLYENNAMVACMGYKETQEGVFDITRYATNKTVVGGFGRLLKWFKRNHEWTEIFTYAHLDYSRGDLYETMGFHKSHETPPGLWYVKGQKRFSRQSLMKHKLPDLLERFDPSKTAKENLSEHGFESLYDAGSIKYVMKNENV